MTTVAPTEAKHYTDENFFKEEQDLLRRQNWFFVGCVTDLSETNAFITSTVAGKPVVVQRFVDGRIAAFLNVCKHRFSLIQGERYGVRSLICPYHGWSYDSSGCLQGIPSRQSFPDLVTKQQAKSVRLQALKVETCGNLVFVAFDSVRISLREFLGACFDRLEAMTNSFGRRIDRNEILIHANWKIVVENTLEAYHVEKVHENSFHKLGLNSLKHTFDGPHSTMEALLSTSAQKDLEKVTKGYIRRPSVFDGYFHQMVFPCMTFASTAGLSFAIQEIEPLSAAWTRFTSHVFFTSYEGKVHKALDEALASTIVNFNKTVFNEDKLICEAVQAGASAADFPSMLGQNEDRIAKYQAAYWETLDTKFG